MKVGVAQVDITPEPGGDLSGFAARVQPSTGILDRLYARCLYLCDGPQRLLWINADLIGQTRECIDEFRRWAALRLKLAYSQVMLSATHTHSGPATIEIVEAGRYDPVYVRFLRGKLQEVAEKAVSNADTCTPVFVEGRCDLAVDRRRTATARTDPRVAAIGFRRDDGAFAAVLTNHAMQAVALGANNRMISADSPGRLAAVLSERLPGHPIVMPTNGACANLNPPYENVTSELLSRWGVQVAEAVADLLVQAEPMQDCRLRTASRLVFLPLDVLTVSQINKLTERYACHSRSIGEWGDRYGRALERWRRSRIEDVESGQCVTTAEMEVFGARIGPAVMLGVNAEVFSAFTDMVRQAAGSNVYTVGYANGVCGYLPTTAAYDEGGYEVETAHFFYNNFRFKAGGLERLVTESVSLVGSLLEQGAPTTTDAFRCRSYCPASSGCL
jgi:neutral ceramidase